MDRGETAERTWQASPELLALVSDAPHRAVQRFGPVVAADLGVRFPWGLRAHPGAAPVDASDAADALRWCERRDRGSGWSMCLPAALPVPAPWRELRVLDELPTFASAPDRLAVDHVPVPAGVTLSTTPSHEDVVTAYGAWMQDDDLARRLVVPDDLALAQRSFIVAFLDDRAIGCAFVWWAVGTAYLSGIGVAPQHRGRGIGHALTLAACQVAVTRTGHGTVPDVIWMHATDEGAALYARMGFERIGSELHLAE